MEYDQHRSVAYQVYLSRPRGKGEKPVSIQKFHYLPYVDDTKDKGMTAEQYKESKGRFLAKLKREKNNGK